MDVVWSVLQSLDFNAVTFGSQILLFFVLHFSLNFIIYQPIMEIRDRRDQKIASSLAGAEAAAEEARRLKSEYEEKVRDARAEGQVALQKATEAAEAERKTRVEKAREEAAVILREAREEADEALSKAEATLESQSEQVAKAIASKLLTASLGESEGKELVSKFGGAS
jgi:F-type H+-transporting ATPase subunit b